MGVGDPVGMVEAVALGVDLFDCVLPTRLARHGTVLTVGRGGSTCATAAYAADDGPLDPTCGCAVCARWSRGYLRHLLLVDEPTAPRLLTHPQPGLDARARRPHPGRRRGGDAGRARAEVAERWPAGRAAVPEARMAASASGCG